MQSHFELFNLPQQFLIDANALDSAYREVQSQVHPDKFANAGDAEKRVAMQWATRANEAYQVLKNPMKRASYLCQLNGADLQTESNTSMPREFLMQQMEWREALEQARSIKDISALEGLEAELSSARKSELAKIAALADAGSFDAVAQGVRKLMFLEKFGEEIGHVFELIEV